MKKMPTLFTREYDEDHVVRTLDRLARPEFACVLRGETIPTLKVDGSACAWINGKFYKRYDNKKRKQLPEGSIPCETAPDPITGHWPFWVPVYADEPGDKWFIEALERYMLIYPVITDGTYEAIGKHFNGNPYRQNFDILTKHGSDVLDLTDCSFDGIRHYLEDHNIEGIVFWKDGEPLCKIKRSDFGLPWPDDWSKYNKLPF